jgi:hypothetical protein
MLADLVGKENESSAGLGDLGPPGTAIQYIQLLQRESPMGPNF